MPGTVTTCTNNITTATAAEAGNAALPTKLFIGGISRHTTTKQLRDHFSKFGRVLDCVAMRTQDGHPRGFGYVTLDSPTAAQQCLHEPQLIDNRIVDMKLAVPEGSGPSPSNSMKGANFNMGMFAGPSAFNMDLVGCSEFNDWSEGSAAYDWWSPELQDTSAANGQGPDCLDLLCAPRDMTRGSQEDMHYLSGGMVYDEYAELGAQDPSNCMGLLLPPFLSSEPHSSNLQTHYQQQAAQMSASAPEFVPQIVQDSENATTSLSTKGRKAGRARAPLGELTNITQSEDILQPFKSPSKKSADVGIGTLSPTTGTAEGRPKQSLPSRTGLLLDDEEIYEDTNTDKVKQALDANLGNEENACTDKAVPAAASQPNPESVEEIEENISPTSSCSNESVPKGLVAEGEAAEIDLDSLPSIGSAQHSIGECKRCNFFSKGRCQNGKNCEFCHFPHDKRKLSRQEKRDRRGAWQLEGLQGEEPSDQTGPALPPGLVPWQPEQEALLSTSVLPMDHIYPGFFEQFAFPQISVPLTSASSVLSTVPSPALSAASTPFPTPLPTPTAASSQMEARTLLSTTPAVDTTSSGTKAERHTCPQNDAAGAANKEEKYCSPNLLGHLGYQWARDELLQLRGVLMKMPEFEKHDSSWKIRTEPITASGSGQ